MQIYKFLVIVSYGELKNVIDFDCVKKTTTIQVVRTDLKNAKFIKDINEAFEFSGYQEGLEIIKDKLKMSCDSIGNEGMVSIIFLNDTAFKSHLPSFTKFLVESFSKLPMKNYSHSKIIGLETLSGKSIGRVSKTKFFLSSWAFVIQSPLTQLANIVFYDGPQSFEKFIFEERDRLPLDYKGCIDRWLMPKSFFRGWYQSIPGKQLGSNILRRKYFTIYLEHTMVHRFKLRGFDIASLLTHLTFARKLQYIFLRFADRVYVNFLKTRYRLKEYLTPFFKSL